MNKQKLARLSPDVQMALYTRYSQIIRQEIVDGNLLKGMLSGDKKAVSRHLRHMKRVEVRMTRLWQVMDRTGVHAADRMIWGGKE